MPTTTHSSKLHLNSRQRVKLLATSAVMQRQSMLRVWPLKWRVSQIAPNKSPGFWTFPSCLIYTWIIFGIFRKSPNQAKPSTLCLGDPNSFVFVIIILYFYITISGNDDDLFVPTCFFSFIRFSQLRKFALSLFRQSGLGCAGKEQLGIQKQMTLFVLQLIAKHCLFGWNSLLAIRNPEAFAKDSRQIKDICAKLIYFYIVKRENWCVSKDSLFGPECENLWLKYQFS